MDKNELEFIKEKLKNNLSKSRYEHSLGVAYTCTCLAMRYNINIDKAFIAGLLHDCAKFYTNEELIKLCTSAKLNFDIKSPQILHAVYAPVEAKKEYNIEDTEILSALRYHTTGKEDMTKLEKIVYVADFIEAGRGYFCGIDKIRKTAFFDLTYTVFLISHNTISYLQSKGLYIDDMTIRCLDYLKENGIYDK